MNIKIGQNIRSLRQKLQISQEDLAETMGVTIQAISKWETGKTNPDLFLLPKLAEYFGVTIDNLFFINQEANMLSEDSANKLEHNTDWWAGIPETAMTTTALPNYGFFTPTEDTLCLLGDIRGKTVLELACGNGESVLYMDKKGAKELWGLDISSAQIKRAQTLLNKNGKQANLFVSPMELNPGLPHGHFDLIYSIYGLGWSMDLDKTINHISEYLKPGGKLIFTWDNPLMQCIKAQNGQYILSKSYIQERNIQFCNDTSNDKPKFYMHNLKLSTYLNCLSEHNFFIEKVVEESAYDEKEAETFEEGKYYSAHKARFINNTFIIKARKL